MIELMNFVFNELEVNSYILYDETEECMIVDPACNSAGERKQLHEFILGNSLKPVCIINTHGHFDHIIGNSWAKETFKCPLYIHKGDLHLLLHAEEQAGIFGFYIDRQSAPDGFLDHDQVLKFGLSGVRILHVPGHSPGSICLYANAGEFLICGDVLFKGSIGRTDLFEGDFDLLMEGINKKIMTLPQDTVVWPGHGPETTIRHEYDTNPFIRR